MHCASCGEPTATRPCSACGDEPLLDGRYRLQAVLGEGGGGTTWRAEGPEGPVALKELPLSTTRDGKQRELFRREADVLRQLDHPQIPRWIEDFETGTGRHRSLCVVQALVPGETLRARLAHHRYDADEVLVLLADLCGVLDHLHGRSPPVVHRDLKPGNVMRRPDGTHVMLDFGSVRDALKDPLLGGSTVTGTFGYMAPEQFAGDASPATDLYGLGALAVALLTRQEPSRLLVDGRLAWRTHARVPAGVGRLIDDLLAPDPVDRPPSAAAVAVRIAALREGVPTAPPAARRPPAPAVDRPPVASAVHAEVDAALEDLLGPEAPAAPPAVTPSEDDPSVAALALGAVFGVLALGGAGLVLAFALGGAVLVAAPEAPVPVVPPVAAPLLAPDFAPACPPAIHDPAGVVRRGVVTADWVAGSADGRRVAVLLDRGAGAQVQVVEVGGGDLLWEGPVAAGLGGAGAWRVLRPTLTELGLSPDLVPSAVPWCGAPGELLVDGTPLTWNPVAERCASGGSRAQFEVCDDAGCTPAPPLDMCWDDPPRPAGAYRLGEVIWLLVERPMGAYTPRFVVGLAP